MEQDGKVTIVSELQPDQTEQAIRSLSVGDFPDYDMSHGHGRKAYIFNHENFQEETLPTTKEFRHGSSKDAEELTRALQFLNFDVDQFDDLEASQFREKITELAEKDYLYYDCLLVVVMSHGENGKIYASNLPETYGVEEIWAPFLPENCPSLAGKPKLFFIQACRAFEKENALFDEGTVVSQSVIIDGPETTSYWIPTQADFLFVYSTIPGYPSMRHVESGSFFIQALRETFLEHGRSEDLLSMMTAVLRKVATNAIELENRFGKFEVVQMPCFTTQLIRKVYFPESNWIAPKSSHGCCIW